MSTIPRVSSAVPGQPPHFGSVLAHQPLLAARFAELYGAFWSSDRVGARVKELCRMRNARVTQCGFCRQVRFDKAIGAGLDEAAIDDVTDDYAASAMLSDAEKAALRFTDALIFDPALFDGAARAALARHFAPDQIEELGIGVTLFLALAKVLITLGLEPEAMDRTVLPTPSTMGEAPGDLKTLFERFLAIPGAEGLVDPRLLDRARSRIRTLHAGEPPDRAPSEAPDDAALAFAEKLPFDHLAITDAEAATVRDALGEPGFVAFTVAVALADGDCRRRALHEAHAVPA